MYCENCGNKINSSDRFCTKCGHSQIDQTVAAKPSQHTNLNDKWWYRLLLVIYVSVHLPLLAIIPLVWNENLPYCYSYSCHGSYGEAFWYSLLTLAIYIGVLRLIKIAIMYIAFSEKPKWKKEFKKLY